MAASLNLQSLVILVPPALRHEGSFVNYLSNLGFTESRDRLRISALAHIGPTGMSFTSSHVSLPGTLTLPLPLHFRQFGSGRRSVFACSASGGHSPIIFSLLRLIIDTLRCSFHQSL